MRTNQDPTASVNSNAGSLIDVVRQAVVQAGANPLTRVHVRVGPYSTEHEIRHVKAVVDQRGLYLLIEADEVPVR